jgi:putative DNA primase/helicase
MNDFYDFIRQLGYEPIGEIVPNKFIRFGRKKSVSAKLFADGKGGFLHDWRTGEKHYWFENESLSHQKRQERQKEIERIKHDQDERQTLIHKKVAIQAKELFTSSIDALESHPYLIKKKVKPFDIRQQGNNLLIPVCSVQGDYQSIQFINPDGQKWFLKGGKTKGGCHFIGEISMNKPVYIAEGYATAYSVYKDTGCLSIVAFNASNLVPVAVDLRKHLPAHEIVIASDCDPIGQKFAIQASQEVNGSVLIPDFGDNLNGFSDWNDFLTQRGVL